MIRAEVLDALLAAGATAEMIVAAVKADGLQEELRAKRKRASDAERQRRSRASRKVTVTECDPPNESILTPGVVTEADASSTTRRAVKAHRLSENWEPSLPLPPSVQKLVDAWPEGRMERELDGFRDYWTTREKGAARSDWDKTWWNRIRDQHDRIIRENRHVQQRGAGDNPASQSPSLALLRRAEAQSEWEGSESDREAWPALRAIG